MKSRMLVPSGGKKRNQEVAPGPMALVAFRTLAKHRAERGSYPSTPTPPPWHRGTPGMIKCHSELTCFMESSMNDAAPGHVLSDSSSPHCHVVYVPPPHHLTKHWGAN